MKIVDLVLIACAMAGALALLCSAMGDFVKGIEVFAAIWLFVLARELAYSGMR